MDGENPLPLWLRQTLIGVGLFLAGAVIAFGYSYRPLHGALSWQVEQLETRLHERNRENLELSDALARQESIEAEQVDPDTFAQVERELEQTKRVLQQAEKDLKRADRKRKDANSSAAKWRKRYEELRDAAVASAPAPSTSPPVSAPGTAGFAGPDAESAPAAPAPAQSPDGQESGILPLDAPHGPAAP